MAEYAASASKDPSTKVGAVIIDEKRRIVSIGYNGFARGVEDTIERLEDRELKYRMIIHAERNALMFANRSVDGCTLYTWPFQPCTVCAALVIQSGIKRVVAPTSLNPRWMDDFKLSSALFGEANVTVNLIDLIPPDLGGMGIREVRI
jgi:dCMP deaminase